MTLITKGELLLHHMFQKSSVALSQTIYLLLWKIMISYRKFREALKKTTGAKTTCLLLKVLLPRVLPRISILIWPSWTSEKHLTQFGDMDGKSILQVPDTGMSQYWSILEHFWCTSIA